MEPLSTLSDFLINGFILSTVLLFIGQIVLSPYKPITHKLVIISNKLLMAGATIFLAIEIIQFLLYSNTGEEWERYVMTNRLFGPYWFAYSGRAVFKGLLPQILWIKKLRNSIWTSLALIPFLLIDFYMPAFYSHHNDYSPTNWTLELNYTGLFFTELIYSIVLIVYYVTIRRKNVEGFKNNSALNNNG